VSLVLVLKYYNSFWCTVHLDIIILLYLQTGIHLNSHSFPGTQFVTIRITWQTVQRDPAPIFPKNSSREIDQTTCTWLTLSVRPALPCRRLTELHKRHRIMCLSAYTMVQKNAATTQLSTQRIQVCQRYILYKFFGKLKQTGAITLSFRIKYSVHDWFILRKLQNCEMGQTRKMVSAFPLRHQFALSSSEIYSL